MLIKAMQILITEQDFTDLDWQDYELYRTTITS
jgi:hypothetical protein